VGGKDVGGQTELILLVPLLLAILFLNLTVMQYLEDMHNETERLRGIYEGILFGYTYATDPATGNLYPIGRIT